MANNRSRRASALTATFFALFLLAFTLCTIYIFVARVWWFPESITALGRAIDVQFMRTLWITGVVFFLAQLALGFVLLRYRDRGGRAHYSHGNNTLEILWTSATAILFVGLGIAAESAWADYSSQEPSPHALELEVIGEQFKWSFRYPGLDGVFGRYKSLEQVKKERKTNRIASPWELDPSDPAGRDDLIFPPGSVIAVPVDREVKLLLLSKDVTHSFFVRELRFKQDTVPGMVIQMRFTAETVKEEGYEVVCAELCGLGHHQMRTLLKVLPQEEFDAWLQEQAAY